MTCVRTLIVLAAVGGAATRAWGATALEPFVQSHCLECHAADSDAGGLELASALEGAIEERPDVWERVVRKLTLRQMPPLDVPRPSEAEYEVAIAHLESALDQAAAIRPDPGSSETFRRLNRTEYQHTIRDLLAINVDAAALLPEDESSHGFDNVTIAGLAPATLNRAISAAQKISRLAVGRAPLAPVGDAFRIRPDVTQDVHIPGTPLGTRGGMGIDYYFPRAGEYEIQIRLMRDRNEGVEGLREPHELEIAIDRERAALFEVKPPARNQGSEGVDANLTARLRIAAGLRTITAAFLSKSAPLLETERQPLNVHFNFYRHPRIGPAVYEVSILGPFDAGGPGDTPSRRKVFVDRPTNADEEFACAEKILTNLARRAYRRPVSAADLEVPLEFYRQGRASGDFESGIEGALSAILANPNFLFRIESAPVGATSGSVYRLADVELASRLSYFLWSSMPDDELLELAEQGELHHAETLERQARRMLADARSQSLVSNFAGQWLHLRNLESITPDMRAFPDFDDNLRRAMREETELLFASVLRDDRSALDLIRTDHAYLNERLARHYGIAHVYGSHFRRVTLNGENLAESRRGGVLRHASLLTVTSYPTRTSPVLRGHWVLKNLLGAPPPPPPPPPPNVPPLEDNVVSARLSLRERLDLHRADAACASCHDLMDPIGFALENYDGVGRWRTTDGGRPIDAAGGLPDGGRFVGVEGLEQALLDRPEWFVRTLTEKLLTFALGRGVEPGDGPAVRQIVRAARSDNYRLTRVIMGIVASTPFQMRRVP